MASTAAETLGITALRLKKLGLTDQIIPEPLGGAHRDIEKTMKNVKAPLKKELNRLRKEPIALILENRYERLMSFGQFKDVEK